ncbi:MAG TPA: hypothetical protein VIY72_15525 [Acidimicrobiales bacterium]
MSRSRRRPAAKKQQADRAAARKFWGEIPEEQAPAVRRPDDPTAMIRSLGEPPLRNNERPAQAAFTLVTQKASHLAFGLAVAAGLDEDLDAD